MSAAESRSGYGRKNWGSVQKNVDIKCSDCPNTFKTSANAIKEYGGNGFRCQDCRDNNKKEMDEALAALARRKGLIR